MSKLTQITTFLETWAPLETQADWDNSGLQLGNPDSDITSIGLAIDINQTVLKKIAANPVDLVITHHPLFFSPIKQLHFQKDIGLAVSTLIRHNCQVYTIHTNLDVAKGGVNDSLIPQYDLDPKKGTIFKSGFGKWFSIPPVTIDHLKEKLPCRVVGDLSINPVTKIAFLAGSGKSFLSEIANLDIQIFVTGELGYHDEIFCELNGICALLLGHKESEVFVLHEIQRRLEKEFSGLKIVSLTP